MIRKAFHHCAHRKGDIDQDDGNQRFERHGSHVRQREIRPAEQAQILKHAEIHDGTYAGQCQQDGDGISGKRPYKKRQDARKAFGIMAGKRDDDGGKEGDKNAPGIRFTADLDVCADEAHERDAYHHGDSADERLREHLIDIVNRHAGEQEAEEAVDKACRQAADGNRRITPGGQRQHDRGYKRAGVGNEHRGLPSGHEQIGNRREPRPEERAADGDAADLSDQDGRHEHREQHLHAEEQKLSDRRRFVDVVEHKLLLRI